LPVDAGATGDREMKSTPSPHSHRSSLSRIRPLASAVALAGILWVVPTYGQFGPPRSQTASPAAKPSAIVPASATSPGSTAQESAAQPTSLLQEPPTQAMIEATPGSLKIEATNASLTQTLQRISEKTGMHVEGVTGDERVFGTFGPGDPRDVLISLLDGTSYNVILVGKLETGMPRELLLSQKPAGPAGPQVQTQAPPSADDDVQDTPQSADEAQPIPPPGRPGSGPGGQGPRNPQELLQQLRQQQQQQQQNQPQ